MARAQATSEYVCQSCAAAFPRWEGQCRACGAWNSLVETLVQRTSRTNARSSIRPGRDRDGPRPLVTIDARRAVRRPCGMHEVDRLLGGGLVPGSVLLLGGEPGIGKSTLVLQVASALAGSELPTLAATDGVLYASAEESAAQLQLRATRLGMAQGPPAERLAVLASTETDAIIEVARGSEPALLVVDSIQTVAAGGLDGPPGSVGQVRESAARLGAYAREHDVPVLLVGHVTKDGSLAGPRSLEHLVDAVLMLEGDRYGTLRLLRSLKNRHGSTDEVGVMEMTASGLVPVTDTTGAFLGSGTREAPGVAVAAVLEGSRVLLVEVQALVAPAGIGPPRRTVAGIEANRLALLIAVLARRGGVDVTARDVYASLAGGLTVSEPALDLPLALAIASSQLDRPLRGDTFSCGEVSLLGEVRPVRGLERRLREAARLGFGRALVPRTRDASDLSPSGLEVVSVGDLREAIRGALGALDGTSG